MGARREQKEAILKEIVDAYLGSRDFNGMPLSSLVSRFGGLRAIQAPLEDLVREGAVGVHVGRGHPNPHIKAFPLGDADQQVSDITGDMARQACLYPEAPVLKLRVDPNAYAERPFTLKLALGEPQLSYYPFDLRILEEYRNDPRYRYSHDDIQGSISFEAERSIPEAPESRDDVFLEHFGFAYDREITTRAVAVFLCYLSRLRPEHQRRWQTRLLVGDFFLHPEYARMAVGELPESVPLFTALLMEMEYINKMASAMRRPPFFRKVPSTLERPRGLEFLIRPTRKEYEDFVHLLDRLLCDNINVRFFQDEIQPKTAEGITKGTITMLDEWLTKRARLEDPSVQSDMINTLRRNRRIRSNKAHNLDDDVFDQAFFREQRQVARETYSAVRSLRMILELHPAAALVEVDEIIREGKITSY